MWKRDDQQETPEPRAADPAAERPGARARSGGERATIGRSITIRGEVTGDEDLLIQGRIEGSIDLRQHAVTVGSEGDVKADVVARVLTIEGRVKGNLSAEEQVVLRSSARVEGDISAPRLVLEDGARFRGGVDMGDPEERMGRKDGGRSSAGATTSAAAAPASSSSAGAPATETAAKSSDDATGPGGRAREKLASGSSSKP